MPHRPSNMELGYLSVTVTPTKSAAERTADARNVQRVLSGAPDRLNRKARRKAKRAIARMFVASQEGIGGA